MITFLRKKKKNLNLVTDFLFLEFSFFYFFYFLGKIRKARLSHSLNRLSVVLNCIVAVKLWPDTGYR